MAGSRVVGIWRLSNAVTPPEPKSKTGGSRCWLCGTGACVCDEDRRRPGVLADPDPVAGRSFLTDEEPWDAVDAVVVRADVFCVDALLGVLPAPADGGLRG